jgi:hypothetical protein
MKLNRKFFEFTATGVGIFLFVTLLPANGRASDGARRPPRSPVIQASGGARASQPISRQSLAGSWKLNRAQSDDPTKKVPGGDVPMADSGIPAPSLGTAPQDSGGISGIGGGLGGMGNGTAPLPTPPAAHSWETEKDRQRKLEYLMPAGSLGIEQKDGEFDLVDDRGRKQILYTDSRKLHKSKDDKLQEFAAHLDAGRLVYAEKRPPHATVTRTFELSPDGRQMYETTEIDNGSLAVPVDVKYVYDAAPASAQP